MSKKEPNLKEDSKPGQPDPFRHAIQQGQDARRAIVKAQRSNLVDSKFCQENPDNTEYDSDLDSKKTCGKYAKFNRKRSRT